MSMDNKMQRVHVEADLHISERDYDALVGIITRTSDKSSFSRIDDGLRRPAKKVNIKFSRTTKVRVARKPDNGLTGVHLKLYQHLSKEYGGKSFVKGLASNKAKKTIVGTSATPAMSWLCRNGYLAVVK